MKKSLFQKAGMLFNRKFQKSLVYLFGFHFILLIIRVLYVLFRDIDLSTEEAQYWLWSKHLDWSYYSKPPLIAYLNAISTSILGDTEIGVRINAIIIGFFIAIFTYFFTKILFKDEKIAILSSIFIYFFLPYDLASILFLTDSPFSLFWVLTLISFYLAFNKNRPKYWILTGVFAGLGFLSKFLTLLFYPLAFLFLLFYRKSLIKEKWFYISFLIFILFTIPIMIWNIQHDFITLKHIEKLAGFAHSSSSSKPFFNFKYLGDYILGQIGFGFGFLFPFVLYAVFKATKEKKVKFKYLIWFPLFVFLLFLFISLKKRVYVNWPVFSYFTLYILTLFFIYKRKLYKLVIPFLALNLIAIVITFYTPLLDKVGLTNLLPPEKDPTKRLVGWEGLGNFVSDKIKQLKTDKYFVFSDSYHIASELAFYIRPFTQTYCINTGRRMNQFDLWPGISQFENQGYYGIYVTGGNIQPIVLKGFDQLITKYTYKVKYRGKVVNVFYIYVLKNLKHIYQIKPKTY